MMHILFFCLLAAFSVHSKIISFQRGPMAPMKYDSEKWEVVETSKLFSSKVPVLFNKQHQEIFGPILSNPVILDSKSQSKFEELEKTECSSPQFNHKVEILKNDSSFLCDISFSKDGKEHRQIWVFQKMGKGKNVMANKTMISFSVGANQAALMNSEVNSLKKNLMESKK